MTLKKYILPACAAILTVISLTGCDDDTAEFYSNELGSTLEINDSHKISRFRVAKRYVELSDDCDRAIITFSRAGESSVSLTYEAAVRFIDDNVEFAVEIPRTANITNGEYTISAEGADGRRIGTDFTVEFRDEMLHAILGQSMSYTLSKGSGTADDPYLIRNQDEFNQFLYDISRDSTARGKGKHFRQTTSINAPFSGESTQGRGYESESFAGSYDGGGFSIERLNYIGNNDAAKDMSVGLFDELLDGASVSNLTLDGINIQKVNSDCGAIAGRSSGNVSINNVKVTGTISDCGKNIGGLIGYAEGDLNVNRYDFSLTIRGKEAVGGAIGRSQNASCTISGVTTQAKYFLIEGEENAGGLIGHANGSVKINNARLTHSVSGEDSDIKTVSGRRNTGGLIGLADLTSESSITASRVQAPVGNSNENAGGFMGQCIARNTTLTIDGCGFNSIVTGYDGAGGFFGIADLADNGLLSFEGDNDFSEINSGATGVSAQFNAGGVAGTLFGIVEPRGTVIIEANINCHSTTGGFAGYAQGVTLSVDNIKLGKNVRISGDYYIGGMFGYLSKSTITSSQRFNYADPGYLEVPKKSRFTPHFSGTVNGKEDIGGIAGRIYESNLKAIHCAATVNGEKYTGGIAGDVDQNGNMDMHIEDCTFSGTISQGSTVGGIAGAITGGGYMVDCINYSDIRGKDRTGGIAGHVEYNVSPPRVHYCVNTGSITGAEDVGGVIARMTGGGHYCKVTSCGNYGSVTGTSGGVGGIVGSCTDKRIKVLNCANHGHVSASGDCHGIGGVAGALGEDPNGVMVSENLEVGYCFNDGEVSSSYSNNNLGGILGYQEEGNSDKHDHDSWLHDSLNRGHISSKQHDDNGGILGKADHYAYVEKTVNLGDIAKGNGIIGTHKSAAILYHDNNYYQDGKGKGWPDAKKVDSNKVGDKSSYPALDFNNIWTISDGSPWLRDCPFQRVSYHP